MKPSLDERHVRLDDFETRVGSVEFSPEIWAVLARLDQPRSASQLAPLVDQTPEAVAEAFARLVQARLIRKELIGWKEFAAARPAAPAVSAIGRCPAPASLVVDGAGPIVSLRIGVLPSVRPQVSLRLGGRAAAAPAWRLRPVLDAIAASAGGGIPGRLLVCKVFLQVPPDLLKAAGVESINTVGDDVTVSDPRLRAAIIAAARAQAHVDVSALAA